jgi:hypothetical protein
VLVSLQTIDCFLRAIFTNQFPSVYMIFVGPAALNLRLLHDTSPKGAVVTFRRSSDPLKAMREHGSWVVREQTTTSSTRYPGRFVTGMRGPTKPSGIIVTIRAPHRQLKI